MFASIQSLDNTTAFRNATNSTGSLVMELKSFVGKLCGESFLSESPLSPNLSPIRLTIVD